MVQYKQQVIDDRYIYNELRQEVLKEKISNLTTHYTSQIEELTSKLEAIKEQKVQFQENIAQMKKREE